MKEFDFNFIKILPNIWQRFLETGNQIGFPLYECNLLLDSEKNSMQNIFSVAESEVLVPPIYF